MSFDLCIGIDYSGAKTPVVSQSDTAGVLIASR